jgi:acetyl-CoA carboxylase biotin carboxyl carrier protein
MDLTQIKKLIKIVEASEITDFSIQEGDLRIKISKNRKSPFEMNYQVQTPVSAAPQPHAAAHPVESEPVQKDSAEAPKDTEKFHEIRSPIVGTFYRAPAPDADPYVQIGDQVSDGTVLCIVEAMKLMNEIESDMSGKVVKILVENGTPVEYNQPIFLIEKT